MPPLEVLSSYKWPTDEFPLAAIGVRLKDLSARAGFPLQQWEEDGLGCVSGVMCRTASGTCYLLREYTHAIEHLGATGPGIWVDAEEVGARGVEAMLFDVLGSLGVTQGELTWVQDASAQEQAAVHGRRAREYLQSRCSPRHQKKL